ncbi:MAG: rRNA pseudouridine synthase [Solirubrobacterales bacterium]|jgi:23S rRNA pseudouridine2605 synthase|nr:rRNA pseudouridine synthase [Solirubrobacterales bacterium]
MRLSRYLAHGGISSRRGAEELIRDGRVTVAGEVVTDPARDVDEDSSVRFDGKQVRPVEQPVVIALNKPKGVVSTAKDTHDRPTVVTLIGAKRRLYPVGRLDADTTGLILLTDDGELANRLTHPRYGVPKTYRATVAKAPIKEEALERLRTGVELEDGMTAPAEAKRVAPDKIELIIREGKKRQVRRMLEEVGHPVKSLQRVAFGPLKLDLGEGAFRQLTKVEIERLRSTPGAFQQPKREAKRPPRKRR